MKRMIALFGSVLLVAGCQGEADSHDFHIERDGSVTWSVLQQQVRSTDENSAFLADARAGRHTVARALTELGARSVETRIVRDRPPYFVVTQGEFEGLDWMLQGFLDRLCVPAVVDLRQVAGLAELRITYLGEDDSCSTNDDSAIGALVGDLEDFRFVLSEGEFVEARNFRIEQEGTVAVAMEPDDEAHDGESPGHRLVWRSRDFGPSW